MSEPDDFVQSVVGARFRRKFTPNMAECVDAFRPPSGTDYFEWRAVFESVESAGERYVMVDLGAGYGWWGINAAAALRRSSPDKPGQIVFVEAEPAHYEFLQEALADNPFPAVAYETMRAAVGDANGRAWFYTGNSTGWYGQRLILDYHRSHLDEGRKEHVWSEGGKLKTSDGYELSEVDVMPLATILSRYGPVDFLDMDIQGTELEIVQSAREAIYERCRRIYISTHSEKIHTGLLEVLGDGFELVVSHPPHSTVETAEGTVKLLDGVQHWKRG